MYKKSTQDNLYWELREVVKIRYRFYSSMTIGKVLCILRNFFDKKAFKVIHFDTYTSRLTIGVKDAFLTDIFVFNAFSC